MLQTAEDLEKQLGQDVVDSFFGLSDNTMAAVYGELAKPYTPRVPDARSAELNQFSQTSAGKILASQWGHDAPRRLAVVLYRWNRMTVALNDYDFAEIDDFWRNRLRASERAAILDRLTS